MSNNKWLKKKQINRELVTIIASNLNDIGFSPKIQFIKFKYNFLINYIRTQHKTLINLKFKTSKHKFKYLINEGKQVGFHHSVW